MKLSQDINSELQGGVSQARLAEIAGVSASTVRGYEKEGLIPLHSNEGKKLYGTASLEALERVRTLKATGETMDGIKTKLLPTQKSAAQLLADLEDARQNLEAARAKLSALAGEIGERIVVKRNELRLTKEELEAVEALRQQNLRRAVQVERKANSLQTRLQYRAAKPHVVRVDLPQAQKRKK
jgi:DNA-binding transcriptional MerR regulator